MYTDLFRLCGFEPEEMDREGERVKRALSLLGLGPDAVELAVERIETHFDIELQGIRKVLGFWLKELADMVLAKEDGKKVVYASFPPAYQLVAAMSSAAEDVYCIIPEVVLGTVMSCFFMQINPILEVAEQHGMTPGIAFCTLLKSRFGAIQTNRIPKPDLLVPSCLLCDQSPKTDEMLEQLHGIPVAYVDNIFDDQGDTWPDYISPDRVAYMAADFKQAADKFKAVFGYEVTEEKARLAIENEARLFNAGTQIWPLMSADPVPLRHADLAVSLRLASVGSRRALREGIPALNLLCSEVKKRVEKGIGVVQKSAPRIMFTIAPYDPAIPNMLEDLGLGVPVTSTAPVKVGSAVKMSYGSIWEEVADSILRRMGWNYSAEAYVKQVLEVAKQYHVDGAIVFRHIGCRQYNTWWLKSREVLERELKIPVLHLDGDFFDFRDYAAGQMKTRFETFAQVVKAKKDQKTR